jgi:hypothetical protein
VCLTGAILGAGLLGWAPGAVAQEAVDEGRFGIGPQVSFHIPIGGELKNSVGLGVSYRLSRPAKEDGWGPDFALGWYSADLADPLDGHIKVRPLMAGASYAIVRGRMRYNIGAVTGPAFTKVEVLDADRHAYTGLLNTVVEGVDVKNAWALKPGVRAVYTVRRNLSVFAAADYEFVRATLQIHTAAGRTVHRRLNADLMNLKFGGMISFL